MKIFIKEPFQLRMELIETDQYVPSFKALVTLNAKHPTGEYVYHANDIWFTKIDWNNFKLSLQNILSDKNSNAVLNDMSDFFSVTLESGPVGLNIKAVCKEPIIDLGQTTFFKLVIVKEIDRDMLFSFNKEFTAIS